MPIAKAWKRAPTCRICREPVTRSKQGWETALLPTPLPEGALGIRRVCRIGGGGMGRVRERARGGEQRACARLAVLFGLDLFRLDLFGHVA